MKKLIIFFTVLFSINTHSQLANVLRFLGRRTVASTIEKQIVRLSEIEAANYLSRKVLISSNEVIISSNNNIYAVPKEYLSDPLKNKSLEKYISESYANAIKKLETKIKHTNKEKIRRIQLSIIFLNYKTKTGKNIIADGIIGSETKEALNKVFNINCNNLSDEEIINRLEKKISQPNLNISKYDLTISKKESNEIILKESNLSDISLKNQIEKLTCSIGDICFNINDLNGSAEFECEYNGFKCSINIATEGKVELGFKSPQDTSIKLSIDSTGKINMTNSFGQEIE